MTVQRAELLELARKLLEAEIGRRDDPESIGAAIEDCFERLHDTLVGLVGEAGFEAILARAARLGKLQLGSVALVVRPAIPKARLPGLGERLARGDTASVIDAVTSLLADLLGLSCRFIGEDLVLRIVRGVWVKTSEKGES